MRPRRERSWRGADRAPLRAYAAALGLAFQIADDILDVTGDAATTGKRVGKDAGAGKATFVSLLGLKGARARAAALVEEAAAALGALWRGGRELDCGGAVLYRAGQADTGGPMADRPKTPLLDRVTLPSDMKALIDRELHQLADELRAETISAVSVTGGHLGAGLGVVELTVALHAVFDTPRDKLIWDVGHQCYPHKILTGRRDRIRTLRTEGGLSAASPSGPKVPYDPFGAAHSSTSISAALGLCHGGRSGRRSGRCDCGDRRWRRCRRAWRSRR